MEESNKVTENIEAETSKQQIKNEEEPSQLVSSDDKSPEKPIVPTQQFTEEEIQNLHEIFKLFDKNDNGFIEASDLKNIMDTLNRDPTQVDEIMNSVDPNQDGKLTFQEFIKMMGQLENKLKTIAPQPPSSDPQRQQEEPNEDKPEAQSGNVGMILDSKVLDFLRLLEEYRKKCESEGNYTEAKKSKLKYSELLKKETMRQKNNLKASQEMELMNIENAQKKQFIEFSQAWDNYMADYEATAYLSLEKLKEKHVAEFQEFQQKIRKEMMKRFKYSREVLELRKKESVLVKLKQYDEANGIKRKAEVLEAYERQKLENEIQIAIDKKEAAFKKNQQNALTALLNRIQRDRNEQLKHRQQDSMRLIQRNKNLLNDLINKQNFEAKRILDGIKQNMELTKVDKLYVPERKLAISLPPQRKNAGQGRVNSANPRPRGLKAPALPPSKLNTSLKQVL